MARDGALLKRAREEAGLSLRDVARHMSVEHTTVLRWEDDGRLWFWAAWSLASLYGCPVAAFGDGRIFDAWVARRNRRRSRTDGQ